MTRLVVAICSTDPLTVPGLACFLAERPDMAVVPAARVVAADIAVVAAPVVTAEVTAELERIASTSNARIILVTDAVSESDLRMLVRCGVGSVLPRATVTAEKLVNAILMARRSLAGSSLGALVEQLERVERGLMRPRGIGTIAFGNRERDLLQLLAQGLDTAEIAGRLAYSERTVKKVIRELLDRLELKNRAHAVAFAMRSGAL
jgi:DNA-binding NarL/FixJ family response regulator